MLPCGVHRRFDIHIVCERSTLETPNLRISCIVVLIPFCFGHGSFFRSFTLFIRAYFHGAEHWLQIVRYFGLISPAIWKEQQWDYGYLCISWPLFYVPTFGALWLPIKTMVTEEKNAYTAQYDFGGYEKSSRTTNIPDFVLFSTYFYCWLPAICVHDPAQWIQVPKKKEANSSRETFKTKTKSRMRQLSISFECASSIVHHYRSFDDELCCVTAVGCSFIFGVNGVDPLKRRAYK